MSRLIRTLTAAAALAALACAAPAAHADSIAYVKDGDVWLSTPDGARQYRVTATGGYSDVTQADDGTMIALTGVRFHRLDREGHVLADFDTWASDTRPPGARVFAGPYEPAISPDGKKVAFTWYYTDRSETPDCYRPLCEAHYTRAGTGYSSAFAQTALDAEGYQSHSGWLHPSWIEDDLTMLSDPTVIYGNKHVVLDHPSAKEPLMDWYSDTYENANVQGGEMTRAKDKLAFVEHDEQQLRIWRIDRLPSKYPPTDVLEAPELCYFYSGPVGGRYGTPSWAPDGRHAVFTEGDGIHVIDVPDLSHGCTTDGASDSRLLIPGASEPDWGPADVPPARPQSGGGTGGTTTTPGGTTTTPGGTTTGPGGTTTGPGHDVPPPVALTASAAPGRLVAALAKGMKVRATLPGAGTVTAAATMGGRTVATLARRTVAAAGPATLTLRVTKTGRRALRGRRHARLVVRIAFTPTGAKAAQRVTTTLSLR